VKTLTTNEAMDWVQATGLTIGQTRWVEFATGTHSYVFTVRWPKKLPYQVPYFAALFLPHEEVEWLFWLTDNGASLDMFDLASRVLQMVRASHGESRPILESPAYLLGATETVDAKLLVTAAVLFCWDVYIVPQHGRYFIWIDDDEAADVWCRDKADYELLLARFTGWGLVPET
jgi:hypothetical protein